MTVLSTRSSGWTISDVDSNALFYDAGPLIHSDLNPVIPRFLPTDAYYVYLVFITPESGDLLEDFYNNYVPYSERYHSSIYDYNTDEYIEVDFGDVNDKTDTVVSNAHVVIVWYPYEYNEAYNPHEPSVSPQSFIPNNYTATGTDAPVSHPSNDDYVNRKIIGGAKGCFPLDIQDGTIETPENRYTYTGTTVWFEWFAPPTGEAGYISFNGGPSIVLDIFPGGKPDLASMYDAVYHEDSYVDFDYHYDPYRYVIELRYEPGKSYIIYVDQQYLNTGPLFLAWGPGRTRTYTEWQQPNDTIFGNETKSIEAALDFEYASGRMVATYGATANFYEHGGIIGGEGSIVPQRTPHALACMWTHVTHGENGGYGSFGTGPGITGPCPVLTSPSPTAHPGEYILVGERESWDAGFFSSDQMDTTMEESRISWSIYEGTFTDERFSFDGVNFPSNYDSYEWEGTTDGFTGYKNTFISVELYPISIDSLSYQAFNVEFHKASFDPHNASTPDDWISPGDPLGPLEYLLEYHQSPGGAVTPIQSAPQIITTLPEDNRFQWVIISSRLYGGPPVLVNPNTADGYEASIALLDHRVLRNFTMRPPRIRFLTIEQGEPPVCGVVPPMRQRARDDGLATDGRQEKAHGSSLQTSIRRGGRVYY